MSAQTKLSQYHQVKIHRRPDLLEGLRSANRGVNGHFDLSGYNISMSGPTDDASRRSSIQVIHHDLPILLHDISLQTKALYEEAAATDSGEACFVRSLPSVVRQLLTPSDESDALAQVVVSGPGSMLIRRALNQGLPAHLNTRAPFGKVVRSGGQSFHAGDRIIVSQNNFRIGLFTGQMGVITAIDDDQTVHLEVSGFEKKIPAKEMVGVSLAYSVSVHQLQGNSRASILLLVCVAPSVLVPIWVDASHHQTLQG